MENDLKSKIKDLESTDKGIKKAEREERIAELVANLISTYGNLVIYHSSIDEYCRQEQVSTFLKIREDAKKCLEKAKEFDYLPTIKTLSDTLADEVEKRKKLPVTIYHEAY